MIIKVFFIVLHNCVIHPFLPLADLAELVFGKNKFSRLLDWMHDRSAVKGYG